MLSRLLANRRASSKPNQSGALLTTLLVAGVLGCVSSYAQIPGPEEHHIEGYVTQVESGDGFDVNGEHVVTHETTTYGFLGANPTAPGGTPAANPAAATPTAAAASPVAVASPGKDAVHIGVYVRVTGAKVPAPGDKKRKRIDAVSVLVRDDSDKKLTGFGVIEKIRSQGTDTLYIADGYRIRLAAGADISFGGDLKALANVGPNTWVAYKGKRDSQGVLVASSARFVPAGGPAPKWLLRKPKTDPIQWVIPAEGALINDNGTMKGPHDKVRLNDDGS